MRERQAWKSCVALGLVTFIMAGIIFPMFPADAAGDISSYSAPIYAFEFAHTQGDLLAIFGDATDPTRDTRIAMMDRGNRWDFLFMTLYTAFGAMFGWAVFKSGSRLGLAIVTIAAVGGIADAVETSLLLSITADLKLGLLAEQSLHWLHIPVTVKFVAIGVIITGAAVAYLHHPRLIWKSAALTTSIVGMITVVAAFGQSDALTLVGPAIGLGWIAMLLFALLRLHALYQNRAVATQPPP